MSDSNGRKEGASAEYDHDHMIIAISKKENPFSDNCPTEIEGGRGLRIYIPISFSITLEKAQKIARREGRSLSDLIRDLLRDYVERHEPGNPQLPIDRFLEEPKDQIDQKDQIDPEDLRVIRMVIAHLESGYDLNLASKEYHRKKALKYRDHPEAQRLLELLDRKSCVKR